MGRAMYRYDEFDATYVHERAEQFKDQIKRRLDGSLTEEEFRPLRLRNGLYLQLHAYMLRVAIPYGTFNSVQMRALADIAQKYDRNYGHFTTRQNIQFNWIKLEEVGEILEDLAKVQMHALQTSGNCIRNITADHLAGIAKDEVADPRPVAELIRQWSTNHPEFLYLPRKFKFAVIGSETDRAAIRAHDIGLELVKKDGQIGVKVFAGGGLGRTPVIGKLINEYVPLENLLGYLEAVLRVYNAEGRRDNKYKARIKILLNETGKDNLIAKIEEEYAKSNASSIDVPPEEIARINKYFAQPILPEITNADEILSKNIAKDKALANFVKHNCHAHVNPDYLAVLVSLKPIGGIPGDVTSEQMRFIADLADEYSQGELRSSHTQNIVLPNVAKDRLAQLFAKLKQANLATANIGLITDIIACPGLDYCGLATARSIPIAQAISEYFADSYLQDDIGEISIKISGCINACGHHHIGNIGILGLEKAGRENYQITLGGDAGSNMSIGNILGPGIDGDEVPKAIERIINAYKQNREAGEAFIDTFRRIGIDTFKAAYLSKSEEVA